MDPFHVGQIGAGMAEQQPLQRVHERADREFGDEPHQVGGQAAMDGASPQRRLAILSSLSRNKIPCGVMVAALIPALNDKTMEHVLESAAAAGARGR